MYGLYSRAAYNQEQLMMARVRFDKIPTIIHPNELFIETVHRMRQKKRKAFLRVFTPLTH